MKKRSTKLIAELYTSLDMRPQNLGYVHRAIVKWIQSYISKTERFKGGEVRTLKESVLHFFPPLHPWYLENKYISGEVGVLIEGLTEAEEPF